MAYRYRDPRTGQFTEFGSGGNREEVKDYGQEYVIYWQKQKRGKTIFPKVHIVLRAPSGQTRESIIEGVEQWAIGNPPPGWTIRAVNLHGKEYSPEEVRYSLAKMIGSENFPEDYQARTGRTKDRPLPTGPTESA